MKQTVCMSKVKRGFLSVLVGCFVGFINGFFGGGGGMIAVPTLAKFYHLEEKKAHATSIAVILPLSIASSIIYLFKEEINWVNLAFVAGGVTVGGIIGALLLKKASNKFIEYLFEGVMLVAGVKMLFF